MVVAQVSKLILPRSSLSPPPISSLLFEPHSLSLALMHSDSSFSLYPSLSPLSLPPPPPPLPTFVPPPSSAASFLLLRPRNPNSVGDPRVLFAVAGPHDGGSALLLRFWILRRKSQVFVKARVVCTQSNLRFGDGLGVTMNVRHGVSIKISGSVNYFAIYSGSNSKIWVFGVKMEGEDDGDGDGDGDGVAFKLMKCASIECSAPVWSINISSGFLILGEENGVRVLPLRPLVKGRGSRRQQHENKSSKGILENVKVGGVLNVPNGVIQANNDLPGNWANHSKNEPGDHGGNGNGLEGKGEISSNGHLERNINAHGLSVQLKPLKLGHDLPSSYFVSFKVDGAGTVDIAAFPISKRAVSIQALSANKFLILDSVGDLHFLCLSNLTFQREMTFYMRQLTRIMKVQKLAVFPDSSTKKQTVWLSDGLYTVHIMTLSDPEITINGNDTNVSEEKQMQISVAQAIFTGEKIQDVVPLAADAILILGQGDMFVYAIT